MPNNPPAYPTIPVPIRGNVDAVHETLMNMKQAIEALQGSRGGQPVTRTFVQDTIPTAVNVGDMWVKKSTGKQAYWDGARWLNTT